VTQPANDGLLDERDFAVLNAVFLRKMASPEHVAAVTSVDPAEVRRVLEEAARDGAAIDLGGQFVLGDDGRARVLAYYDWTYAGARANGAVQAWYERFETVNAQFIALVSEWQKSDGDERVQERLVRLVERQVAALRALAREIPRYENYAARFEEGLTKVDRGERDYVCKPTIDSVHNVWFEFHEDILTVMGKPREA
jgi:hypothetical protein